MCSQRGKKQRNRVSATKVTLAKNQDVFKDILVEPETTTTRGFWGPAGVLPQRRFVFLGSLNLISCNFSTIFSIFIFRQKRTFNGQGEGKTIQ